MKITKRQLRRIIQEELGQVLNEQQGPLDPLRVPGTATGRYLDPDEPQNLRQFSASDLTWQRPLHDFTGGPADPLPPYFADELAEFPDRRRRHHAAERHARSYGMAPRGPDVIDPTSSEEKKVRTAPVPSVYAVGRAGEQVPREDNPLYNWSETFTSPPDASPPLGTREDPKSLERLRTKDPETGLTAFEVERGYLPHYEGHDEPFYGAQPHVQRRRGERTDVRIDESLINDLTEAVLAKLRR